ncbi:tRNA (adenosine(37)-N6)-threonylcarbamoyltransferase complex dimerization subunit type 1 TsaB [Candidatus Peregrinibacteria bacterium CG_4_10_14_0_2_um_filter_43_11]|nr:MAG: tRNA (adenosine(37)-N6)-threonylcarbamoyltransferase complex dimerization subunit type 1 TsaB [Candidatus Peregrinibacteria bacterium CG_4_10_14_0_2_um_filter_43_11]
MFLCIDTCTGHAGIAIVDRERCHAYKPLPQGSYSESILETIDAVMRESVGHSAPAFTAGRLNTESHPKTGGGFRLGGRNDGGGLTGILVISGPGSFTSLRVGIAVANTFAHQLKIPIVGLRTDEWFARMTDETDFLYIQSMNRDEVYMMGFGKLKTEGAIQKHPEGVQTFAHLWGGMVKYLGQLTEAHQSQLPKTLQPINDLKSIEEIWLSIVQSVDLKPQKTYNLVEPFYGKEPTITKSKKR